jgi:hypothetical protein
MGAGSGRGIGALLKGERGLSWGVLAGLRERWRAGGRGLEIGAGGAGRGAGCARTEAREGMGAAATWTMVAAVAAPGAGRAVL